MAYSGTVLYIGTQNGGIYRNVSPANSSVWAVMRTPNGVGVASLAFDGTRLFAGLQNGTVIRNLSPATGNTWQAAGTPDGTMVYTLDIFGANLYAGTGMGRVYRNSNPANGSTWANAGTPDGSIVFTLTHDSARLYAGTFNGKVWRNPNPSTGTTWQDAGSPDGVNVAWRGLSYDRANDVLYAFSHGDARITKNINPSTGSTWKSLGQLQAGVSSYYFAAPLFYDLDDNLLYAGRAIDPGAGYRGLLYKASIPSVASVSPKSGMIGSTMEVTITGANTNFQAPVQAYFSGTGIKVNSTTRLSATQVRANITIQTGARLGARDVWVDYGSGKEADRANRNEGAFTVTRSPNATWYLAEGTNAWGFNTYITIENPNGSAVNAKLTYLDPNPPASGKGIVATRTIALPPLSQTTVSSASDIGDVDFSTKIECLEGMAIAVDRTMFWTGENRSEPGYHSSIGTNSLSKRWYLAEGSSAWEFETWTLVLNPNPTEANVTLNYMKDDGPLAVNKTVPPNSRATYSMLADAGSTDASIEVTSDVPIAAERSMYRNSRREGSCSIGATSPADEFFLAEGAVGYDVGFTTYVLVQNPQDEENEVTITYQTQDEEVAGPTFTMAANTRKTIKVNDQLPANTDVSARVRGSKPLVAERAMYWDNGTGEAFHASVGLASPHMSFMLPDGQNSNGCETWTLVQNPNPGAVTVRITYLPQDGGDTVTFTDEILPAARRTYSMAGVEGSYPGLEGRASILVESLDGARPVMVERAMYWNARSAGTDTIGGFSD
jgi:hypothetical protein